MLAFASGQTFGVPRDIDLGWDATTRSGRQRLDRDMWQEDLYCTIYTQPCAPWGRWSQFNLAKG